MTVTESAAVCAAAREEGGNREEHEHKVSPGRSRAVWRVASTARLTGV